MPRSKGPERVGIHVRVLPETKIRLDQFCFDALFSRGEVLDALVALFPNDDLLHTEIEAKRHRDTTREEFPDPTEVVSSPDQDELPPAPEPVTKKLRVSENPLA